MTSRLNYFRLFMHSQIERFLFAKSLFSRQNRQEAMAPAMPQSVAGIRVNLSIERHHVWKRNKWHIRCETRLRNKDSLHTLMGTSLIQSPPSHPDCHHHTSAHSEHWDPLNVAIEKGLKERITLHCKDRCSSMYLGQSLFRHPSH